MNGFEKHNIGHLSSSSLNLWMNAPDVWVARYLKGIKGDPSPAMARGICVENAVAAMLSGKSKDAAARDALGLFDSYMFADDAGTQKERDLIIPMAAQAVDELKQYGEPDFPEGGGQHKISVLANFGNWSIPVIGYLDFVFPAHGLVIDLKTTTRVPTQMSAEHQLQRAIYQKAEGNKQVKFLYASDKKTAMLEDGDPSEILKTLKSTIARLEAFLTFNSLESAIATIPHNPNSFYWRGDEATRDLLFA